MSSKAADDAEAKVALKTLIRLANSCERAAARGQGVVPIAADARGFAPVTLAQLIG